MNIDAMPLSRNNYVLTGYGDRTRAFHEGVWDGFYLCADVQQSHRDPNYQEGVETGFGFYMLGILFNGIDSFGALIA